MEKRMVLLTFVLFVVTLAMPVWGAEQTAPGSEKRFDPQPEPPGLSALAQQDIKSFQQEIETANGKLAGAKPGADLTAVTLMGSHANMMNLLLSLQDRAKGCCAELTAKLSSLDISLKNFKAAIQKNDKITAQRILNEMGGPPMGGKLKEIEALLAK